MIYNLSQPIFNNAPHQPKFRPSTMATPHLTAIESANVEHLELVTHTGTHIKSSSHFAAGLIRGSGVAWTRPVSWDEGAMA